MNIPTIEKKSIVLDSKLHIYESINSIDFLSGSMILPVSIFSKLKRPKKVVLSTIIDEIKSESKEELRTILKGAFQKCFKDLKKISYKCILFEE